MKIQVNNTPKPGSSQSQLDSEGSSDPLSHSRRLTVIVITPVILITLYIGLYFVIRYTGHWTENDTASMSVAIRGISQSGKLVPETGDIYSNGYAYQVISAFILAVTGIDTAFLQQIIFPFAILLLAIPACILLYEITGSRSSAVLGSILLFTQPEFLFVVLRGSHEKFGRLFMILALFLLFRSFKSQGKLRLFATYVGLFYLVVYGLLSSNFLIGFSFITALTFGLVVGAILETLRVNLTEMIGTTTRRLAIVVFTCFIIAFLLIFYFYPPVQYNLRIINGLFGKIGALALGAETTNVYEGVFNAWINPLVYVMINMANWLIILISFPLWCSQGITWVIKKHSPRSQSAWLLWLLYGAFGFQAILSILSDASGMFNNLQLRLFPSFALLAVAIVTDTLSHRTFKFPKTRLTKIALGISIFLLASFSLIKATNEASLVNWWTFYTIPELNAMQWFDRKIENASLWAGFSGRLPEAMRLVEGNSARNNTLHFQDYGAIMPYFLVSDLVKQQSARVLHMLPDASYAEKIYDNGTTQIYHRHPRTPYQR